MKLKLFVTGIFVLFITISFSQVKKNDPSRWTPEDVISREAMGSVSFSPNSNMVVWTKRKAVKSKDRTVSDIYLVPCIILLFG